MCDTSPPTPVCDTATVTVLVRNVFTDLGAIETTPHNTAVTTSLADILSTTGAPVDPTAVTEEGAPTHGTISIHPSTGAVTYTPERGYAGADSYEVRVCDTSTPEPQCFSATVQVTVQPNVVDAVDDAGSTGAGDAVTTTVRANDTSASGQPLATPTVVTGPGHGTAAVGADGSIQYTPATGFSGTDSYTYRVCDTSHPAPVCDTAAVTITVAAAKFDLRLTNRLISASKVVAGDTVRYKLQVTNRGPDAVTGPIVLTDLIPRGIDVTSAKGDGWRCKVNKRTDKVTCTLDSAGQRAGVTLGADQAAPAVIIVAKTSAKARGKLVNAATVHAAGDTAVANNRAKASVRVVAAPELPLTGLRIGRLSFGW